MDYGESLRQAPPRVVPFGGGLRNRERRVGASAPQAGNAPPGTMKRFSMPPNPQLSSAVGSLGTPVPGTTSQYSPPTSQPPYEPMPYAPGAVGTQAYAPMPHIPLSPTQPTMMPTATPSFGAYPSNGRFVNGIDPQSLVGQSTSGMVDANNLQQQRNAYGSFEHNQMLLGGAKNLQPTPLGLAPKPSVYNTQEGSRLYIPRNGREGDAARAASRFAEGVTTAHGSQVVRTPSGGLALIGAPKGSDSDLRRSENRTPARLAKTQAEGNAREWARAAERTAANGGPTPVTRETRQAARDAEILGNATKYGLTNKVPAVQAARTRQDARSADLEDALVAKAGGPKLSGVPRTGSGLEGARKAAHAFEADTQVGQDMKKIGDNGAKLHDYLERHWDRLSAKEKSAAKNYIDTASHITPISKSSTYAHAEGLRKIQEMYDAESKKTPRSSKKMEVVSKPPHPIGFQTPLDTIPESIPGSTWHPPMNLPGY